MDALLEEQLKRIQELTRRMSRFEQRAAELSSELERGRQSLRHGPLHDVRDLRTYSGGAALEPVGNDDTPEPQPASRRRKRR